MFLIDKDNNKLQKIVQTTFHELGFKEREHLQEWIAKSPSCLDEELLIIQKEFDGFEDTNCHASNYSSHLLQLYCKINPTSPSYHLS